MLQTLGCLRSDRLQSRAVDTDVLTLGLLIAGTLRLDATLAVTNLVWVLLAAVGGTIIPGDRLPEAIQPVVALLPSAALGDGLRAALASGTFDLSSFALLCGWAAVASVAAVRWFKWS